jgi:hypothetical protein
MEKIIRKYSGRDFTSAEINLIKEVVSTYPKLSQRELASTICELIEWKTPRGIPKGKPCNDFLRKLEAEGEIRLPEVGRQGSNRGTRTKKYIAEDEDLSWIDTSTVTECGALSLEIARPGESLRRWRTYIKAFHMLGDAIVNGSRLCYTVKCEGRDIGCLQFSASAWALAARDELIGWTAADRKARLHLVINNSRALIMPWVHVKYLGSRILSLAAKQVAKDWLREYCFKPVLLETFVDTSHFRGTIYKASNWILAGQTKGRGRNDRLGEFALSVKDIYLYPLRRDYREVLTGNKPYTRRDPDEL